MAWRRPAARTKPGYGPDPSCQPCPACGGLECLCRPRFFAGQLLTEQDLNRLDHYITGKHKLHNRHLFGPGVVCGLEVRCDPCDDRVSITPGYALSPCGEDIVVCHADSLDVCDLIARCREQDGPDCRPYAPGRDACDDVVEEWILAIRYAETGSKPVTPLTGTAGCHCGAGGCKGKACACGGGCGCKSSGAKPFRAEAFNTDQPRLRRGAPPSCEPTVICETYRYDVFRKPEPKRHGQGDDRQGVIVAGLAAFFEGLEGEMAERIACCLRDLETAMPRPPGGFNTVTDANKQDWFRWVCAVRQALASYFGRIGGTDCEAIEKLGSIPIPNPALPLPAFQAALGQAVLGLLVIAVEAMLHCICSNALPPCPAADDPRVPLAVVKIRKRDCHIISVCNWTPERRHVVTFPTLGYWLGWVPLRRIIRQFMEALCCSSFNLPDFVRPQGIAPVPGSTGTPPPTAMLAAFAAAGATQPAPAAEPLAQPVTLDWGFGQVFDPVMLQALALGAGRDGPMVAGDLADLAFRRPAYARPDDPKDQASTAAALAESGMLKAFTSILRPLGDLATPFTGSAASAEPRGTAEIAELRDMLHAQASEIATLKAEMRSVRTSGPEQRP
ncbi:hypothetical protein [Falsiroseomonas sp. E2-1-a4]|uniref:hypothetical protein n=1 Tax=Falsiroseomonas sp. E2-1-a4 TaxID=3239299 RepID=UPI003F3BB882